MGYVKSGLMLVGVGLLVWSFVGVGIESAWQATQLNTAAIAVFVLALLLEINGDLVVVVEELRRLVDAAEEADK